MKTNEEALNILKRYWRVETLQFLAHYKKMETQDNVSPYGYFTPFMEDFPQLRYPTDKQYHYKRPVSVYTPHQEDLVDGEVYSITLSVQEDMYRKKHQNPYLLQLSSYSKVTTEAVEEIDIEEVTKTIKQVNQEFLDLSSPYQVTSQANSVNLLAIDIYSENKRFIYELIQNADDAALGENTEVEIRILDEYVVISHKGKPFNGRDIRGLCSVGLGSKANDETKTGYKGIGFKSVFGQPAGLVFVQSNDVLFKFDKNYIESISWKGEWGNKENWEAESNAQFKSPWQLMPILCSTTNNNTLDALLKNKDFTVRTIIKIDNAKQLRRDLQDMLSDAHVLLFLRKVIGVQLFYGTEKLATIQKKTNQKLVELYHDQTLSRSYYLYKRTIDVDEETRELLQADMHTPEKIRNMKRSEFAIAVRVHQIEDTVQLLQKHESPIFSFLPTTDLNYEFPYLVNGNFILDAGRQNISKDHQWNAWLFKNIGKQVVELCSELAENKMYLDNYYELLSKGKYSTPGLLFSNYNKGLEIGLRKIPFILNQKEELIRLDEVCIDNIGLLEEDICTEESIVKVLEENFKKTVLPENIFQESALTKVLKTLNGYELSSAEDFLRILFLSKDFADTICIENNAIILDFLRKLEAADASKKWYVDIINFPFVLNTTLQLCTIKEICYPENAIDEDPEHQNVLMHATVYADIVKLPLLKKWLDDLGVIAPGSIAFLEKEIIGKFPQCIENGNYLKVTNFIMNLHVNQQLTKEHYLDLQALPLLTEKGFVNANQCILGSIFNPRFDFKAFKNAQNFVDNSYIDNSDRSVDVWKSFFIKIRVVEDIEYIDDLVLSHSQLPVEYTTECYNYGKMGHKYPHLIGIDYLRNGKPFFYLQNFNFIDIIEGKVEWKAYWENIIDHNKVSYLEITKERISYSGVEHINKKYRLGGKASYNTLGMMSWGRQLNNRMYVLNYFNWKIKNQKIIPTNQGLQLALDTYTNTSKIKELIGNYFPIIDVSSSLSNGWCTFLGLKEDLSNASIFELLTKITQDLYFGQQLKKENIARIGLLYQLLLDRLSTSNNRQEIEILAKNWIVNHKLPASNLGLYPSSKLVYIQLEDVYIEEGDRLSVLIPKNIDRQTYNIEELFQLFNIEKVSNIIYKEENSIIDIQSKILVVKMLPFVTAYLVNKLVIKNIDKYINKKTEKLRHTNFYFCDSIIGYFEIGENRIKGPSLKFSNDADHHNVFSTVDFSSTTFRFDFSTIVCDIYDAQKIVKEVLFIFGLNNNERHETIQGIIETAEVYHSLFENENYLNLLTDLEDQIKLELPEYNISLENEDSMVALPKNPDKVDEEEEYLKTSFENDFFNSIEELQEFNEFFNLDLSLEYKVDWNAVAIFRAVKYFKSLGYNMDETTKNTSELLKVKYFTLEIEEGTKIIYPRSARQNLLFVSIQLWEGINEDLAEIFVLTGKDSHRIIRGREELLARDHNILFKILGKSTDDRVDIVNKMLTDNINDYKFDEDNKIVFITRIETENKQYSTLFDDFEY